MLEVPQEGAEVTLDVWEDATALYDGQLHHGNGWVTAPIPANLQDPESLAVGLPDETQVIQVMPRRDPGALVDERRWYDEEGTKGFGSAVLVQPVPDGTGDFELWVGSPEHRDSEGLARGAVLIFRHHLDEPQGNVVGASQADLVLYGTTEGDRFGAQLTRCSDLDADGLPEILVWAPWFQTPASEATDDCPVPAVPDLAGAIYVVRSSDIAGVSGTADAWDYSTVWWGSEEGEAAGYAAACGPLGPGMPTSAGEDVVMIGAPWARAGERGVLYLVKPELGEERSCAGPLSGVARVRLRGETSEEWFGSALALLRSAESTVLAVGRPGLDNGWGGVSLLEGEKLAELLQGAAPGALEGDHDLRDLDAVRLRPVPFPSEAPHFGRWLYAADVDGLGEDDLVVGAPDHRGPSSRDFDTGRVWIWYAGNRNQWASGVPDLTLTGNAPFQRIGRSLSFTDVNDDGVVELWVPTGWASAGP